MDIENLNELVNENEKLKKINTKLLKLINRYEQIKNLLLPIINVCKCESYVKKENINKLQQLLIDCQNGKKNNKKNYEDESIKNKISHTSFYNKVNNSAAKVILNNNKDNLSDSRRNGQRTSYDDNHDDNYVDIEMFDGDEDYIDDQNITGNNINEWLEKEHQRQQKIYGNDKKIGENEKNQRWNLRKRKYKKINKRIKKYIYNNKDDSDDSDYQVSDEEDYDDDNFVDDDDNFVVDDDDDDEFRTKIKKVKSKSKHTNKENLICEICNKVFKNKYCLKGHMVIHSGEKQFKCKWPGCNYESYFLRGLRTHRCIHTDERPITCEWPGCEKRLRRPVDLKYHMYTHTGGRPKPKKRYRYKVLPGNYPCSWPGCDAIYKYRNDLATHLIRHKNDKEFICETCKKVFLDSRSLKRHMVVHSEKSIKCDWPECEYKTRHVNCLKAHLKVHSEERPFLCDWPDCGEKFRRKTDLNSHILCHRNEKPFICDICGKEFRYKYNINEHVKKHHPVNEDVDDTNE